MESIINRCDTSIYDPLNSSTLQEKHLEQEKRTYYDTSLPLNTPDVIHNLTLQYRESAQSIENQMVL